MGFSNYSFSSKFTRSFLPDACEGKLTEEPCHVYVTASEPDPSTNMIVNFQLSKERCGQFNCDPVVYYSLTSHRSHEGYENMSIAVSIKNPFFESEGEIRAWRKIYQAHLNDLVPGTEYSFIIYYRQNDYMSMRYKFKTANQVGLNRSVLLAVGTKLSNNIEAVYMNKMIGLYNVDLAIVT